MAYFDCSPSRTFSSPDWGGSDWSLAGRSERPSSPFNHHASFIPFSATSDHVSTTNTAINPSKANYRPCSMSANLSLAGAVGYRMRMIGEREARMIHADAVTWIEKLTTGRPVTRRPRDMPLEAVRSRLQKLVPEKFFILYKISEEEYQDNDWVCNEDILARAAAKYITVLKIETNSRGVSRSSEGCNSVLSVSVQHSEESFVAGKGSVEKALERIDMWCNGWLDGKIEDEDWDKMGEIV